MGNRMSEIVKLTMRAMENCRVELADGGQTQVEEKFQSVIFRETH